MTFDELRSLSDRINCEICNRKDRRFNELVNNVVKSLNALVKEFPSATCYVPGEECEDCGATNSIDLLGLWCSGSYGPAYFRKV